MIERNREMHDLEGFGAEPASPPAPILEANARPGRSARIEPIAPGAEFLEDFAQGPVRDPEHGYILEGLTNSTGRQFTARLLLAGDAYGRDRCLTWGQPATEWERRSPEAIAKFIEENKNKPGIEFYDATYKGKEGFDQLGQFTTGRYYLATIMAIKGGGLNLYGEVPEWTIDSASVKRVQDWARAICPDVKPDGRFSI